MSDLKDIIAASPMELLPSDFYMLRNVDVLGEGHFLVVDDGQERTVLTTNLKVAEQAPAESRRGPFRLLRLHVAVPFEAPGFLAAATTAVASRGMSALVLSTFTFDYLLLKAPDVAVAVQSLTAAGFRLRAEDGRS